MKRIIIAFKENIIGKECGIDFIKSLPAKE